MRDPLSRSFTSLLSSDDSWFSRVRENLRQLFTAAPMFPTSASGAPIHELRMNDGRTGRAQGASMITHSVLLAGLVLLSISSPGTRRPPVNPGASPFRHLVYHQPPDASIFGRLRLGRSGGGGEEDPKPTKHGQLAPNSPLPLAPPRLPASPHPVLPVPAAVFEPNAPQLFEVVSNLGLPWMKNDSDSAGPGKDHGFGSGQKGGMGDDEGPRTGQGEDSGGSYANVVTSPVCSYCPDPEYTEEARKAKVQGTVTLRVLVGTDGRASQIRLMSGIGLGLDEHAAEAIRRWKFIPARDAAKRPVATWVTVETVFRLF
jgi:periplasmic protein TonB